MCRWHLAWFVYGNIFVSIKIQTIGFICILSHVYRQMMVFHLHGVRIRIAVWRTFNAKKKKWIQLELTVKRRHQTDNQRMSRILLPIGNRSMMSVLLCACKIGGSLQRRKRRNYFGVNWSLSRSLSQHIFQENSIHSRNVIVSSVFMGIFPLTSNAINNYEFVTLCVPD